MKKILALLTISFLTLTVLLAAGIASWYTADRTNALTANGEIFDNKAFSAAHKSMTFGTKVKVTNKSNGKSIEVRINDRGPYVPGRIIDLTPAGAKELGFYEDGKTEVTLDILSVPAKPETKYISGAETGWHTLQIGSYTNTKNAYTVYRNIQGAGLKPSIEIISTDMIRISIKNIPTYMLEATKKKLASIGITEPLVKGAQNPYN